MSTAEKARWLEAALITALPPLVVHTLAGLIPGPNAGDAHEGVAWLTISATILFLLILSWRGAYLAGRKNR